MLCASGALALPPGQNSPGGIATRAVAGYTALEQKLLDGGRSGDGQALEASLAEDFAGYSPEAPEPLDRQQFIAAAVSKHQSGRIYNLAVLERDGLDVVSYLLQLQRAASRRPAGETVYIVDVWRREDRRLLARYRSMPRHVPPPPSSPSGRE
jgi:hypothetical protein